MADTKKIDSLLTQIKGRDTSAGYQALKALEQISDETGLLYPYTEQFAAMSSDETYVIRVRGFRLFCRQAKWDVDNRLDENMDAALNILNDPKPTAVRQALSALHQVIPYKPELREMICRRAAGIHYLQYKETMHSLIAKDIKELLLLAEVDE